MSVRINLSSLSKQQIVEAFNHFLEVDGVRARAENLIANELLQHADMTPRLATLVTEWVKPATPSPRDRKPKWRASSRLGRGERTDLDHPPSLGVAAIT